LLRVVADHVARRPGTVGAAVAVEVCSACFSASPEPQNVVASTLFADGAACAVLSTEGDGPVLVDFASGFDFDHIDALGFSLGTEGFRIVLDPSIPERIAASVTAVVDGLLTRNGLDRREVALWGLHPGGARIVDAAQAALGLTDEQLIATRRVLRNHGNMSSPTILFVLAEALTAVEPAPGTAGVIAAFGPGLGVEAALLRF
jgi:predicted naringenin-chalcone synthase